MNIHEAYREVKESGIISNIKQNINELADFFFDDQQKIRFARMGFLKKSIFLGWWLLQAMYNKLTPFRKLLLVLGLVLIFANIGVGGDNVRINNPSVGALALLFIILLELKDKLIATTELHEGQAVQQELMPKTKPQIPGWDITLYSMPANEVGGDLVDHIKISDKRFAFAIADISGKGIGAALLMAKLQSIIRALAPDFTSINDFVKKLNTIFHRDSLKKSFASLIYLELQPNQNLIKYVNAGHLPPILISDDKINEFTKGARALGLSPNVRYNNESVSLKKNDVLLLYSDGVTEAVNPVGEFFESKFYQLLPDLKDLTAEQTGKKLLSEIEKFTAGQKTHDDLSFIIFKLSN